MNIFATNECPIISAQALPDIHVNKMIIETLQLLSTAHVQLDGVQVAYKETHKNHPCAIWVRKSSGNYAWAVEHFEALCKEYTHRTGRVHKSQDWLDVIRTQPKAIRPGAVDIDFMCMPVECKKTLSVYKNYQIYLNAKFQEWASRVDKRPIVPKWTNRDRPEWLV